MITWIDNNKTMTNRNATLTQVTSVKNTSVCLQCQPQMQRVKHHLLYENDNPSDYESLQ